MKREQVSTVEGLVALNTSTTSSAGDDLTGNIIDTRGAEAITFLVQSGTITAGTFTISLEEGDTATLTDSETVASDDLIDAGSLTFGTTDDNIIRVVGYRGNKRYVRLNAVSDATGNGTLSATAFKGYLSHAPA